MFTKFGAVIGMGLLAAFALPGGRRATVEDEPRIHVVVMEGMKFIPSALRVRVGERVEFKNVDLVPHTATAKPTGAFDSGLVKPGDSWILHPKGAGTFPYACTFHPTMTGEITVEKR